MSVRVVRPAIATDLALIVAAAADRGLAAQLEDGDARGHVARAALAVQAGRVRFPSLPDPLLLDVAELLEWAESAPTAVQRDAIAYAGSVVAAQPLPPLRLVGALARWRREFAAGARQFGDEDPLTTAARWEQVALEREAAGDRAGALDEAGDAVLRLSTPPHIRVAPAEARAA